MSENFGEVDLENLNFPAIMRVDYIRIYQRTNQINIGVSNLSLWACTRSRIEDAEMAFMMDSAILLDILRRNTSTNILKLTQIVIWLFGRIIPMLVSLKIVSLTIARGEARSLSAIHTRNQQKSTAFLCLTRHTYESASYDWQTFTVSTRNGPDAIFLLSSVSLAGKGKLPSSTPAILSPELRLFLDVHR